METLTVSIASGVSTEALTTPERVDLKPAYPNPLKTETTISYALAEPSVVSVTLTDLLGRRIAAPLEGQRQTAGDHTFIWSAEGISPGIYVITLQAGSVVQSQPVVVLR